MRRHATPADSLQLPTEAELDILNILWTRGPSTVRDVHEASSKSTGYTTVLKQMQVMAEKGLLERSEEFRSHVYKPRIAKGQTQQRLARNLVQRAFDGSAKNLVLGALSAQKVSPAELQRDSPDARRIRKGGAMTSLTQGLTQLSGHPLVYALGWTLLHFCWQGVAVALVLACVLGLLGGRSSQARYAAACLALGLMVALPLATFAHVASSEYNARTAVLGPGIVLDSSILLNVGSNEPIPPWPARIGMALDRSLPWVLLIWFAGVLVFLCRLNFGLLVARRLKTSGTEPPPLALLQLFETLRIRLHVDRAVQLLHSARVQVPTVIGWLRPVVLLPASCLSGLSPDQIEAVLCHELAHVRRRDYLVSVIQSVIETILFYHPAVWWVSKQVRRERECCCDELAVSVGGDVLAYARALSFLEENRAAFPEFVLGANGGVLKMRIQRILGSKRDAEGSPAAALLTLGLILAVTGSYFAAVSHAQSQARTQSQSQSQLQTPPQSPPPAIAAATTPAGIVSISQEGTPNPSEPDVSPLHGIYKTWLEQDVRWIITDPEAQAFKQLANDEERDKFIEQFWARRDPHDAAPGSYRQEIYARIAYSNEHFAAGKPGWSTDRGHIYIVYGKPQSIDSHPTGGRVTAHPYEIWRYKYIAGIGDNVDLAFVDTCKCGDYHYTIDPTEKEARAAVPGGLVKQESDQLDANDAKISVAKKLLAPPAISDKKQDAAARATAAKEARLHLRQNRRSNRRPRARRQSDRNQHGRWRPHLPRHG